MRLHHRSSRYLEDAMASKREVKRTARLVMLRVSGSNSNGGVSQSLAAH